MANIKSTQNFCKKIRDTFITLDILLRYFTIGLKAVLMITFTKLLRL